MDLPWGGQCWGDKYTGVGDGTGMSSMGVGEDIAILSFENRKSIDDLDRSGESKVRSEVLLEEKILCAAAKISEVADFSTRSHLAAGA